MYMIHGLGASEKYGKNKVLCGEKESCSGSPFEGSRGEAASGYRKGPEYSGGSGKHRNQQEFFLQV